MLETIFPSSCILVSIRPCFFPLAFIFALYEISLIARTISFNHFSCTGEVIEVEIALIKWLSLSEEILSFAMELSICKVSFIDIATKFKLSFTCLLAIYKISFVLNSVIVPRLESFAIVQIIYPLSLVHRPVCSDKNSIPICFPVIPLSLVDIPIWMCQSSLSIKKTLFRLPLIFWSICEFYDSKTFIVAFFSIFFPLAKIILVSPNRNKEIVPVKIFATVIVVKLEEKLFVW